MSTAVYLIQPNYHSMIKGKPNYWLPYSVGLIWSYAIQDPEVTANYHLERMVYSRENIDAIVATAVDGAVYAFSCYLWNWEYNKVLADKIKAKCPNSLIVFGGPQVNNRPLETGFFKQHPYVDSIVLAEGEMAFADCLKNHLKGKRQRIYQSVRLNDLNIPSPYLNGLFDQLIEDNPNFVWSTTIETNRGCPFQCTFCDWGSLTYSKIKKFEEDRVFQELEWMGQRGIDYIFIADANFGIFKERDYKIAEKLCQVKQTYDCPSNLNITFTKNSNKQVVDIVKLFNDSKLSRGLTLSFQSMDATVLKDIKRDNMDINNAEEIFKLLDEKQLTHYSELILGLPSETLTSWKKGMVDLIGIGQHQCIDVFHAMLLENCELNQPAYKQQHGVQAVEVCDFMSTNFGDDDNIVERMQIVRSTNTMSEEELLDAFMFSWIIINFHCYGWTQIYSRFLNIHSGLTYADFYNKLLEWTLAGQLGEVSKFYQLYRNNLKQYLDNNEEFTRNNRQDILREVQQYFHTNKQAIGLMIADFVSSEYADKVESSVLANLVEFQEHFVTSKDKQYPYATKLDLGIQRVITKDQQYSEDIQNCTVDLTGTFANEKEFLAKIFQWRRNGWGKAIINEQDN